MRLIEMVVCCPLCGRINHRMVDIEHEQFIKERDFPRPVLVCEGCLEEVRVPWPDEVLELIPNERGVVPGGGPKEG
ncbi:MAG: hypothetical protein ACYC2T_15220 [Bacillota bacterium]